MNAYVVLSPLIGARFEELQALTGSHVDLMGKPGAAGIPAIPPSIMVWRPVRIGEDTKDTKITEDIRASATMRQCPGPAGGAARRPRQKDRAIITEFLRPAPNRLVRQITTFVRSEDGSWRRDETHHNVLIDTARVPALLAAEGIQAAVHSAFGNEQLPTGLRLLLGQRAT